MEEGKEEKIGGEVRLVYGEESIKRVGEGDMDNRRNVRTRRGVRR